MTPFPPLSGDEIGASWAAFEGKVGVVVTCGGRDFTHPRAGWSIDKGSGELTIILENIGTIAVYRQWEGVRYYGDGLTPFPSETR